MSERLGFTNAQKTTRTMVQAHTYRACLVVGVQELRRGSLLADAGGGTPQRFLWLPAFDPNAPDTPPPCPELLTVPAPRWGPQPLVIPSGPWQRSVPTGPRSFAAKRSIDSMATGCSPG